MTRFHQRCRPDFLYDVNSIRSNKEYNDSHRSAQVRETTVVALLNSIYGFVCVCVCVCAKEYVVNVTQDNQ